MVDMGERDSVAPEAKPKPRVPHQLSEGGKPRCSVCLKRGWRDQMEQEECLGTPAWALSDAQQDPQVPHGMEVARDGH